MQRDDIHVLVRRLNWMKRCPFQAFFVTPLDQEPSWTPELMMTETGSTVDIEGWMWDSWFWFFRSVLVAVVAEAVPSSETEPTDTSICHQSPSPRRHQIMQQKHKCGAPNVVWSHFFQKSHRCRVPIIPLYKNVRFMTITTKSIITPRRVNFIGAYLVTDFLSI